jgi:eukaryotic-like serine/threonine-protein kinase
VRPLSAGARIGRDLEVIGHLHRSRALDVYDAWSLERGSRCTVKVPRPDRLRDEDTVKSLFREGRLLCRLSHPHIVRGYEVLDGPRPAIVLETLGGETLAHMIRRSSRRLSAVELGHLGLQLGSALRYLHGRQVLHLDLKPSNVIVDSGRVKLIDLSLARAPGRTSPGRGTWCYMAPEQARGGQVGPPADVWGLGSVLYEAATGQAVFGEDEDEDDVEYPQLWRRATSIRRHRRLPIELRSVIDATFDPDSEARPQLATVLAICERVARLTASERRFANHGSDNGKAPFSSGEECFK